MKLKYILCILLGLFLSGCETFDIEDGTTKPIVCISGKYYISISGPISNNELLTYGESVEFTIDSDNVSWEITNIPEWLTVMPTKGGLENNGSASIIVKASPNETKSERTAELIISSTIKDFPFKQTKSFKQTCKYNPFAIFYDKKVHDNKYLNDISADGQTVEIQIATNCTEQLDVIADNSDIKCSYNKSDKKCTIIFPENPYNSNRTINIQIEYDGITLNNCEFNQQSSSLFAKFDDQNIINNRYTDFISAAGQTLEIHVATNCPDELKVIADDSDIKCTYHKDNNNCNIVFPENPYDFNRTISIQLEYNGVTLDRCEFTQEAKETPYATFEDENIINGKYDGYIPATGQTLEIQIATNCPDELEILADISDIKCSFNKDNKKCTIIFPENPYISDRTITIQLKYNSTILTSCKITQQACLPFAAFEGQNVIDGKYFRNILPSGETIKIPTNTNCENELYIISDTNKIICYYEKSTKNCVVTIPENPYCTDRTITIQLKCNSTVLTSCEITQQAGLPYAKFVDDNISNHRYSGGILSTGETIEVQINTNCVDKLNFTCNVKDVICSFDQECKKCAITFPINDLDIERTAKIQIEYNDMILDYCYFMQLRIKPYF